MIIKIDHVALYSNHLDKTISLVERCGYSIKFVERSIDNPKIKKALMSTFTEKQSICYMEHPSNLDIEIVTADVSSGLSAYLKPFFDVFPNTIMKNQDYGIESSLDELIEVGSFTDSSTSNFNAISCYTKNKEKSIEFWKILGFIESQQSDGTTKMLFNSIFPNQKNCCLTFFEDNNERDQYYLNDLGFNCLAFITHSISSEILRFAKIGIRHTEVESIWINNRPVKVCFIIGDNGELVELIEMIRV